MTYTAIIAGAGSSQRALSDKLFWIHDGRPVIWHAVHQFLADPDCREIIIMASAGNAEAVRHVFADEKHKLVKVKTGANTRTDTVATAVAMAAHNHVIIHDAARPFLSAQLLKDIKEAARHADAAIPTIKPADTVVALAPNGHLAAALDRERFALVQTPQAFIKAGLIDAYHKASGSYSDESTILAHACPQCLIKLVPGDPMNVKLTYSGDRRLLRG